MIKQQNYTKVAEYTKKAFQVFCKRALAGQLIQVLSRPKTKVVTEMDSQALIDNDEFSNDTHNDRKGFNEDIQKTCNFKHNRQNIGQMKQIDPAIKLDKISYGDFVSLEWLAGKDICKMVVVLDSLKFYKNKEIQMNNIGTSKMCFQICSPSSEYRQKEQFITSEAMVCLKNVYTGGYLHLSENILPTFQFGYQITLVQQIKKQTIFRLATTNPTSMDLMTDYNIHIISYYNPKLSLNVQQLSIDTEVDRILIASYSPKPFRVTKSNYNNDKMCKYYYINCVGINKRVRTEEQSFNLQLIRKQCNQMVLIDDGDRQSCTVNFQDTFNLYELSQNKEYKQPQLCDSEPISLYQVWEIQKIKQRQEYKITNVVTHQSLYPDSRQADNCSSYNYRNSLLQLKKQQHNNQYTITNDDDFNLLATYDTIEEQYVLKFDQESQKSGVVGKNPDFKFQLIELQPCRCEGLVELLECLQLLRNNYPFIQKWGFKHQPHQSKIRYSLVDLKVKMVLIRRKIEQTCIIIDKLKALLMQQETHVLGIRTMAQQIKILELIILYCKIINSKIDNKIYRDKQIYHLANNMLKPLQDKLFQTLYLLIYNNKNNSEIIIEQHSVFFNHLLSLYPETIGALLEESIKNLCLITAKISKQELAFFKWTSLVQFLTLPEMIDVQRKYIDIVSEVAIDPNDFGITPYQNKIKQQLFGRSKKKIFPKFKHDQSQSLGPLICFQYKQFPIQIDLIHNTHGKCFQLSSLFKGHDYLPEYHSHIEYINSILKLMRNLCKDRNRKMPKMVEDYGLTQPYMHEVFKSTNIGWDMVARFLDLYVAMYVVQDPFLSFHKKQVKCFAWTKIQAIDFQEKTAILFRQFTEQNLAQEKLKQFDQFILPLLQKYFNQLNTYSCIKQKQPPSFLNLDSQPSNSFMVFVSIMLQIVNNGFLSYQLIRRYLIIILKHTQWYLHKQEEEDKKIKLLQKVVNLCTMTEQISTIIHGMHILKNVQISLSSSSPPSRQVISETLISALNDDDPQDFAFEIPNRKRKGSTNSKTRSIQQKGLISHPFESSSPTTDHLNIIKFTLSRIISKRSKTKNVSTKQLLGLLQLISQRGQRLCAFLMNLLILEGLEQQNLYLQYSGVTPLGISGQGRGSSGRLLNVMKVKQLVDKITQESIEEGDQDRKKEKIYELNNLLSKIINNLDTLQKKNYRLFAVCQILLQKLNMHSILISILRFQDIESYQELIGEIVHFLTLFVRKSPPNLAATALFFPVLARRTAYHRLPALLTTIFPYLPDQQASFDLLFSNIGKKMSAIHKQILFACIYKIIKVCPSELFDKIKGRVIYSLCSLQEFKPYIVGDKISFSFISLLCYVGQGMQGVAQRVRDIIRKSQLLRQLQDTKGAYQLKWVYLRLYHFLYIEPVTKFDQIEMDLVIQKVFLSSLKYLPAFCRATAQATLNQIEEVKREQSHLPKLTLMKEQIKTQFGSLMLLAKQTLPATQQQSYLNYTLNIQDQQQFSMLVCLQMFITKFNIISIDGLANYIFKLISFMDRIKIKDNTYQCSIFSKLHQITQILIEKYNRHSQTIKLPYNKALPIVQHFYQRIGNVIEEEGISYFQILKCAGVTSAQISSAREEVGKKKMIVQSQFVKFIISLGNLANNRLLNGRFPEQTIKQFAIQIQDKDTHKINILHFIKKLFEVLQYQKDQKLVQHVALCRQNGEDLWLQQQLKHSLFVNTELIHNQLDNFKTTYQMLLKTTLQQKIQAQLSSLILIHKQTDNLRIPIDILRLSAIGQQYSIVHFLVQILIKNIDEVGLINCNGKIDNYMKELIKYAEKECNVQFIGAMIEVYRKVKGKKELVEFVVDFVQHLHTIIQRKIKNGQIRDNMVIEEYLKMIALINCDRTLNKVMQDKIETSITEMFILTFLQVANGQSRQTFDSCQLFINHLLSTPNHYQLIASVLAKDPTFISQVCLFIKKHLERGIRNTNYLSSKQLHIINQICELFLRFRNKGVETQLTSIIGQWPFDYIFQTVKVNYSTIISTKTQQRCLRQESGCSVQYCNRGNLTSYDLTVINTLAQLLTITAIASDLKSNCLLNNHSQILDLYSSWQKGQLKDLPTDTVQIMKIVHKVELRLQGKSQEIYFSLPMPNLFSSLQLQNHLNKQIDKFNKQKYFQNLYKLSFFVQKELQHHNPHDLLPQTYQKVSSVTQIFIIIYLVAACSIKVLFQWQMQPLFTTFNILILTIRLSLLIAFCLKIVKERAIVLEIDYEDNTLFWRYVQLMINVLVVGSYGLLLVYDSFYPVTLLLQVHNLKPFQKMLNFLFEGIKIIILIWIPLFFFTLTCTIILSHQITDKSFLQILWGINYEITMLLDLPIFINNTTTYPLLQLIPLAIPFIVFYILVGKAILIACIAFQVINLWQLKNSTGDSCPFCNNSRSQLQSQGLSFYQHQHTQHNTWDYIYFLIYIRRNSQSHPLCQSLQSLIDKDNFQFLKLDAKDIQITLK